MASIRKHCSERGAGITASAFGAVVFLGFLLLATHVSLGLFATSTLNARTFDAAAAVAHADEVDREQARFDAEQTLRAELQVDTSTEIEWLTNADGDVGLRVSTSRPSVLPSGLASSTKLDRINRTVWVRSEVER